jgi:hypothetical protein
VQPDMDPTAVAVQALPRRVRPFPSETTESYLGRLADANHLSVPSLRRHLTGGTDKGRVPADRLAAASGVSALTLQRALSDLAGQRMPRTTWWHGLPVPTRAEGLACRLCAAASGCRKSIWTLRPPERVLCLHHLRWLGVRHANGTQPSLEHQPEIVRAHLRHLRLVRRYGRNDTARAFAAADWICQKWFDVGPHRYDFERRLETLGGPRVRRDDAAVDAAAYPDVVALARLLISPHWLSVATSGNPGCHQQFQVEIRRTVAPHYTWPQPPGAKDPLFQYLRDLAALGPRPDPEHRWPGDIFGATIAYLEAHAAYESHIRTDCDALFSATVFATAGTVT